MIHGRFLFLGTGSSLGVPVIGCHCAVCCSEEPRNQRLRSAGLIEIAGKRLLIDAGPDIRTQLLRADVHTLDGILFTHAHYDHIAGFDDLRIFSLQQHAPVPCLMSFATWQELRLRFNYLFPSEGVWKFKLPPDRVKASGIDPSIPGPYCPILTRDRWSIRESFHAARRQLQFPNTLSDTDTHCRFDPQFLPDTRGLFPFLNLPIRYCTYQQPHMEVNGYRIGDFAYITDIMHYPPTLFQDLEGIKTLVVSALRTEPQSLHFTVSQAVAFAEEVRAPLCYLTHLAHELDYEETQKQLPPSVFLAYDGLTCPFTLEESDVIS